MNLIKKMSYIFDRKQKIHLVILFCIMFVGGFVELLGVSAILPLIDVIMEPDVLQTNEMYAFVYNLLGMKSVEDFVLAVSVALIFIYIIKNIFLVGMSSLQFRFTHNNQRRLAYKLMDCYMHQDYLFHISKNTADLQRNVIQDVSTFFATVLYIIQLATESIVCIMLIAYLIWVDCATTLGVLGIVGVFTSCFYLIYRKKLKKGGERHRALNALVFKWIHQALGGIKEIKVLNREEYFLEIWDTTYEKSMTTMRKQRMINLIPKPMLETICVCGLLVTMCLRIASGAELTQFVSTLSVFAVAAFRMLPSFNKITGYISNIIFSQASVNSIYEEVLEIERLNKKRAKGDQGNITFDKGITLQNLHFAYPNTEQDVLKGIDLEIPKNKSVAFIGPSGSGKTTLIDLVLGVLDPTGGNILSDGEDIQQNMTEWHHKLGYIPQTIYLIDDTIRANIGFGMPDKSIDEKQLWKALEEAQLAEFVRGLPEGLMTHIGEKGVKLSGGQRQRIGIARTLYSNPEILVMDEATSALDNETEQGVMEAVSNLAGKKTMLIVAHRLTTIVNCDLIYEIIDGKAHLVERTVIQERLLARNRADEDIIE